jgi:hypothetical protein
MRYRAGGVDGDGIYAELLKEKVMEAQLDKIIYLLEHIRILAIIIAGATVLIYWKMK